MITINVARQRDQYNRLLARLDVYLWPHERETATSLSATSLPAALAYLSRLAAQMVNDDLAFNALFDEHASNLLDREVQALLRCVTDEPRRALPLLKYFVELSQQRLPLDEQMPRALPIRLCSVCRRATPSIDRRLCRGCDAARALDLKRRKITKGILL